MALHQPWDMWCGLPQGSCFGPLLFSVFINKLPFLKKSNIAIYVDDSTIYATAPLIGELNSILQEELNSVAEWICNNKLTLSVGKTKSILFCSKYQFKPELTITLNIINISVEHVYETNVLGVMLDYNLLWSKQTDIVVGKMGRGVS